MTETVIKQTQPTTSYRTIFGFGVFFALFLPEFFKYFIVSLTFKPLPFGVALLLPILGAILASICFFLMLRTADNHIGIQATNLEDTQTQKPLFSQTLAVYLSTTSVWFFLLAAYVALSKYVFPKLPELNILKPDTWAQALQTGFVPYYVVFLIAIILGIFGLCAGLVIIFQKTDLFRHQNILFKTPLVLLKNFHILLLQVVLVILAIIIFMIVRELSGILIIKLSLTPLLELFYYGLIYSTIAGILLSLIYTIATKMLVKKSLDFATAFKDKSSKLAPIILAVVLTLFILQILPFENTLADYIEANVKDDMKQAEKYKAEEKFDLAVYYYKRSYAVSKATSGYLKLLSTQKDPNLSPSDKSASTNESTELYRKIEKESPISGVFYYLNYLRYTALKIPGEQLYLSLAASSAPDFPNAQFELLASDKLKQDKNAQRAILNKLVGARKTQSYTQLGNLSQKDLAELGKKFDAIAADAAQNFPLLAYYYYDNKLYAEAQTELAVLMKDMPDNVAVQYLTAMVDLEMMADNKRYDQALSAADTIYKKFPNEQWAQDLKVQVAMKAGDTTVLEKTLADAYNKKSSDPDISEQYAYSLMKKNTSYTIDANDKKAEQIIDKVIKQDNTRWFAHYCKAILNLKKKDYTASLNSLGNFAGVIQYDKEEHEVFDDMYYLYTIKYKNFLSEKEAKDALEKLKDIEPFAYNYIWGAYFWSAKDFNKAVMHLDAAISMRDDLAKLHFLLGSVYFENAYLKKNDENYSLAETEYKKSLAIFENDPYTWFSLAHVFKKQGRDEEALGAFQKTLYHMPAEDHNMDYYGVSIHSKMQIDEIQKKLGK